MKCTVARESILPQGDQNCNLISFLLRTLWVACGCHSWVGWFVVCQVKIILIFFLFWVIVIQKRCFKRQKKKAEKLRKNQEKERPETNNCVCVSESDTLIHKPYRYFKKFKDMGQLYWRGHWVCLKVNDAKILKHESWWLWQLPSLNSL